MFRQRCLPSSDRNSVAFTKGHKAPLDIYTDSKVPSNANQVVEVEIKSYLKRIVPKEDWGSMILQYPADETVIRRLKYCCVTFQYTGLLNVCSY